MPLALLVHNVEEGLALRGMLADLAALLPARVSSLLPFPTLSQYVTALVIVTIAGFVLYLWARRSGIGAYVLVALQATMALNVVTHVGGAAVLGRYVPGMVTALLVQLPVSIILFTHVRRAGWLSRGQWLLLPVLAVLFHGPVLWALLWGREVFR